MKKRIYLVLTSLLFFTFTGNNWGITTYRSPLSDALFTCSRSVELRLITRQLWDQHLHYNHSLMVSSIMGTPDRIALSQRLTKNLDDIGDAIKHYFGEDAGEELTALLKEHEIIAADVLEAAKSSDRKDMPLLQDNWKKNADEIAVFLSQLNSYWPYAQMQPIIQGHLKNLTNLMQARLKLDWQAEINYYDSGEDQILIFADMLTDGIVQKFPDKFK